VGLLDGDIAALMGEVMGQFYLDATLRTVHLVPDEYGGGTADPVDLTGWVLQSGSWDDGGTWRTGIQWDISKESWVLSQAVKAQEDRITEEARLAGSYSQLAKRFIVLQSGTSGWLTGDSELTVGGVTYMLSTPEQDPAKAYWYVVGVPK
jgi:hypothetical protein